MQFVTEDTYYMLIHNVKAEKLKINVQINNIEPYKVKGK